MLVSVMKFTWQKRLWRCDCVTVRWGRTLDCPGGSSVLTHALMRGSTRVCLTGDLRMRWRPEGCGLRAGLGGGGVGWCCGADEGAGAGGAWGQGWGSGWRGAGPEGCGAEAGAVVGGVWGCEPSCIVASMIWETPGRNAAY